MGEKKKKTTTGSTEPFPDYGSYVNDRLGKTDPTKKEPGKQPEKQPEDDKNKQLMALLSKMLQSNTSIATPFSATGFNPVPVNPVVPPLTRSTLTDNSIF